METLELSLCDPALSAVEHALHASWHIVLAQWSSLLSVLKTEAPRGSSTWSRSQDQWVVQWTLIPLLLTGWLRQVIRPDAAKSKHVLQVVRTHRRLRPPPPPRASACSFGDHRL